MAKSPNGLGQFSGKLGAVVYAVRGGEQIVRAYQPVVSNPKSTAQMLQRAKGNVVGRLSAITPREVILGLGSNTIRRRSRFLQLALRASKARFADGDYIGSLPESELILSEGSFASPFEITSAEYASNYVTISIMRNSYVSQEEYDTFGLRAVVYAIDNETGDYDYVVSRIVPLPTWANTPTASFNASLYVSNPTSHIFAAYIIPWRILPSYASTLSRSLFSDDNEYMAALSLSEGNAGFEYGISRYHEVTIPSV